MEVKKTHFKNVIVVDCFTDIRSGLLLVFLIVLSLSGFSQEFTPFTIDNNFDRPLSVFPIDLDMDGDVDVVAVSRNSNDVVWYENDGSQGFTRRLIDGNLDGARTVFTTDLDDDGDLDILATAVDVDELSWYENNGNEQFTKRVISNSLDNVSIVISDDLDQDGDMDVIVTVTNEDDILWFENDGSENFTERVVDNNFDGANAALVATDIDGDGDRDIVSTAVRANDVAWFENDGNQNFTKRIIDANFGGPLGVDIGDFDDDGDIDILAASRDFNDIVIFVNNGSQTFTRQVIDADFTGARLVATADMDNDGDLDVLATATDADDVALYTNNGNLNFEKFIVDANLNGAFDIHAADIDSNGIPDILATGDIADDIIWYRNEFRIVAPLVVTNTADTGTGSLRAAIEEANTAAGADRITFNIPGAGAQRIVLASNLPIISETVSIEGGSQTDFSGSPLIEIQAFDNGFVFQNAPGSSVSDLAIFSGTGNGIIINSSEDTEIERTRIGTDASGSKQNLGFTGNGIIINESSTTSLLNNVISGNTIGIQVINSSQDIRAIGNIIGLAADEQSAIPNDTGVQISQSNNPTISGNSIAGNLSDGIVITQSTDGVLSGNTIGANSDLSVTFGNGGHGIFLDDVDDLAIDGTVNRNVITASSLNGITVIDNNSSGITIQENSIFDNGILGIDLNNDGIDENDPLDADVGPNALLNNATITFAEFSEGNLLVQGSIVGARNQILKVEAYNSAGVNASGNVEGQEFIGSQTNVRLDANGFGEFFITGNTTIGSRDFVSVIVEDRNGNTSEFSLQSPASPPFEERLVADNLAGARTVFVVDLDQDNDLDIVAMIRDVDDVIWLENDGNQNFTSHLIFGSFDGAVGLDVKDVDNDGDLDILGTANIGDDLAWFENDGNQNFTRRLISGFYDGAQDVEGVDLDNDGDLDLITAGVNGNNTSWFENDGNQSFTQITINNLRIGQIDIEAVDLDEDGDIDILEASRNGSDIAWLENDGNQNFTRHLIDDFFRSVVSIKPIDLDNDGDIDILGAARDGREIAWYSNDGNQNFTKQVIKTAIVSPFDVDAADVDGDGDFDVFAISNGTFGDVVWFENDGNQQFTERVLNPNLPNGTDLFLTDLDKNSRIDIVAAAGGNSDRIIWFENLLEPIAPLLVTNTNDAGPGSLRQAILEANALPVANEINFDIPGNGPFQINLQSDLPQVTETLAIDASGLQEQVGVPLLAINAVGNGIVFNDAPNSVLRGLTIHSGNSIGVRIINSSSTTIANNYIGTDASGSQPEFGFDQSGITVENSSGVAINNNLIASSRILIDVLTGSDRTRILGNLLGTSLDGTQALGGDSIAIRAVGVTELIIGDEEAGNGNVINVSGDFEEKIGLVIDQVDLLRLENNLIGTNASGSSVISEFQAVTITDGLNIALKGNLIAGSTDHGVNLNGIIGGSVIGNLIGSNLEGTSNLTNGGDGIHGFNIQNVIFGGITPDSVNVISGNLGHGIFITDGTNLTFTNNLIGTDLSGSNAIPNKIGIEIINGNTINLSGNTISGNTLEGIILTTLIDSELHGNRVGIDVSGSIQLANGSGGLKANALINVELGGNDASEGNVISGNGGSGIMLSGNMENVTLQHNTVGLNASQNTAIPNAKDGILISGSDQLILQNNHIAFNKMNGINIINGSGNLIGGISSDNGNEIHDNQLNGIRINEDGDTSSGNTIRGNSIFNNDILGIDLSGDGIDKNDLSDVDEGPNSLLNFPEISNAIIENEEVTISGNFNSTPNATFSLDFYINENLNNAENLEGQEFLGSVTVETGNAGDVGFSATFPTTAADPTLVSATATDVDGNTSEFFNRPIFDVDIEVVAVTHLADSLCFDENERVRVRIRNAGLNEIAPGAVTVSLNGAENLLADQSNQQTLAFEETEDIVFTNVDLSVVDQLYELVGTVTLASDESDDNDTATQSVTGICFDEFEIPGTAGNITSRTCFLGSLTEDVFTADVPNNPLLDDLVGVRLDINHPDLSNLLIHLVSPEGQVLQLHNRNSSAGEANLTNTLFTDDANFFIDDGLAPFTGSFKPLGSQDEVRCTLPDLPDRGRFTFESQFADIENAGTWQLIIGESSVNEVTAALNSWSLVFSPVSANDVSITNVTHIPNDICLEENEVFEVLISNRGFFDIAANDVLVQIEGAENNPTRTNRGIIPAGASELIIFDDIDLSVIGKSYDLTFRAVYDLDEILVGNERSLNLLNDCSADLLVMGETGTITDDNCSQGDLFEALVQSGAPNIRLTSVELDITHESVADLAIYVVSPAGTVLQLARGSANGENFESTIFEDAATTTFSAARAPYTGSIKPFGAQRGVNCLIAGTEGAFTFQTQFGNENPNGIWTLHVIDRFEGRNSEDGVLNQWKLGFSSPFARDVELVSFNHLQDSTCFDQTERMELVIANRGSFAIEPGELTLSIDGAENSPINVQNSERLLFDELDTIIVEGVDLSVLEKQYNLLATVTQLDDSLLTNNELSLQLLNNCLPIVSFDGPTGQITRNTCNTFNPDTFSIEVPITGLRLDSLVLDIDHGRAGSVEAFLRSPEGKILEITTANGSVQDDYSNTVFKDGASNFITEGTPPFRGGFKPEGRSEIVTCNPDGELGTFSFASQFSSGISRGTWDLIIFDNANSSIGTLEGWSLHFSGVPPVDVAVAEIFHPIERFCFDNNETIEVTIRNNGLEDILPGTVGLQLFGAINSPVNSSNQNLLSPGETELVIIEGVDLSNPFEIFDLQVVAELTNDPNAFNDDLQLSVFNICDEDRADIDGEIGTIINSECENEPARFSADVRLPNAKIAGVTITLDDRFFHDDLLFFLQSPDGQILHLSDDVREYNRTTFTDTVGIFIDRIGGPEQFKPAGRIDEVNCDLGPLTGAFTFESQFSNSQSLGEWQLIVHSLDDNTPDIELTEWFISFEPLPERDIRLLSFNEDFGGICLDEDESIVLEILNVGTTDIAAGELDIRILGSEDGPVLLTNDQILTPFDAQTILVDGLDLSTPEQLYELQAIVELAGDENNEDNTLSFAVINGCNRTALQVTNTNDDGPGSLRQAILNANNTAQIDTIEFLIVNTDAVKTISPLTPYPVIQESIWINGGSQPLFKDTPLIEISGNQLSNGDLLQFQNTDSVFVTGLTINNAPGIGISMLNVNTGFIEESAIGLNENLIDFLPNRLAGIRLESTQDVIVKSSRIAGNIEQNLLITGAVSKNNTIQRSVFGLNINNESRDVTDNTINIRIESDSNRVGGMTPVEANLIAGEFSGVEIAGDANQILNNLIGIDSLGNQEIGHFISGIAVFGKGNIIGLPFAGNVISRNRINGISLRNGSDSTFISGNTIGLTVPGDEAAGNGDGIAVSETAINGFIGSNVEMGGNVISGNFENGISINESESHQIINNLIGTDVSGLIEIGNIEQGISVIESENIVIGTVDEHGRNIISGNDEAGISVQSSTSIFMSNNFIGLDIDGQNAVPNQIGINGFGGFDNTIGSTDPQGGNVISGNSQFGIELSSATQYTIINNKIGTDEAGLNAVPNQITGIIFDEEIRNRGLIRFGSGEDHEVINNLISGNASDGISITNTINTTIKGNAIGTNITEDQALGNGRLGISLFNGSNNIQIGTSETDGGNVISGNGNAGIQVLLTEEANLEVRIHNNHIGTDGAGNSAIPNATNGILISNVSGVEIGGAEPESGNIISGNTINGITITESTTNLVQNNIIGANTDGTFAIGNQSSGILINESDATTFSNNLVAGNVDRGVFLFEATNNDITNNTIGTDITRQVAIANAQQGIVVVSGQDNTISNNLISGNGGNGVEIETSDLNRISGNTIGLDGTGNAAIPNQGDGIFIHRGGDENIIGVVDDLTGNTISGNQLNGIVIADDVSGDNEIFGNIIGLSQDGVSMIPNGLNGVLIREAENTQIGGTGDAFANIISGNLGTGIQLEDATAVEIINNFIGTDLIGESDLGNQESGISISDVTIVTILDNLIGGNGLHGIEVKESWEFGNVAGNIIGLSADQSKSIGNDGDGIHIEGETSTTLIGGLLQADINVISSNGGNGISVVNSSGEVNVIARNIIGSNEGLALDFGNTLNGIQFAGSQNYIVGGEDAAGSNRILFNQQNGVFIGTNDVDGQVQSENIRLTKNTILDNGVLGIAFGEDQNAVATPELIIAANVGQNRIQGTIDGVPNTLYLIEFFTNEQLNGSGNAEGATFYDEIQVRTDVDGFGIINHVSTIILEDDLLITATATQSLRNTSQFSTHIISNAVSSDVGIVSATHIFGDRCFTQNEAVDVVVVNNGNTEVATNALQITISGAEGANIVANNQQPIASGSEQIIRIQGLDLSEIDKLYELIFDLEFTGDQVERNNSDTIFVLNKCNGNELLVTNRENVGPGSLRQAILDANSTTQKDTIAFVISGRADVKTILPQTALPTIAHPIMIDGSSQPLFSDQPLIQIDGRLQLDGGLLTTDGVNEFSFEDISLVNGPDMGVHIQNSANGRVRNVMIGVDANGLELIGNGAEGLLLENSDQIEIIANNISGNLASGILVDGNSDQNLIGTIATAGRSVARTSFSDNGNIISANADDGILIRGSDNQVVNNFIGTSAEGTEENGNGSAGILLEEEASNNIIDNNLISGNENSGIIIDFLSVNNQLTGNIVGLDINGETAIPNGGNGILISDGSDGNTVGGSNAGDGNIIAGNEQNGIELSEVENTTILGNKIGTNNQGDVGISNQQNGVLASEGTLNTTIGGLTENQANQIAGNVQNGIHIDEAEQTLILGNKIGTDQAGNTALPNERGVLVEGDFTIVGNGTPEGSNLISGNNGPGIQVESGELVFIIGNKIGTNIDGNQAVGNESGVIINNDGTIVGGVVEGEGNLISGNDTNGIDVNGNETIIIGNLIGTDEDGESVVANQVGIVNSGNDNVIGLTRGDGNVISGNQVGIRIADGTRINIKGNLIGTNLSGDTPLGNSESGIEIFRDDQADITMEIGGLDVQEGNLISGNGIGVFMELIGGRNVLFQRNFIGTDFSGTIDLGNETGVVVKGVDDLSIGRGLPITQFGESSNTIAFNDIGIFFEANLVDDELSPLQNNEVIVRETSLFGNKFQAIVYDSRGLPNELTVIIESVSEEGDNHRIQGRVTGVDVGVFLEFYATPLADINGQVGGKRFIGERFVNPDPDGDISFDFVTLNFARIDPSDIITGLGRTSLGNISIFSEGFSVDGDALPVTLLTFDGEAVESDILLKWETLTELNNEGFEVQRWTADDPTIERIGFVEGNGTSTQRNTYDFIDHNVLANTDYYYRLKQVDFDGAFEFSSIIQVTSLPGEFGLGELYPNPASDQVELAVNHGNQRPGKIVVEIVDLNGRLVSTRQLEEPESSLITLDVSSIPAGLYQVLIKIGSEQYTRKLSIVR
ncbi:MAG: FG-GAP-like repeat-containing protein [Bacteroidota bacterium]